MYRTSPIFILTLTFASTSFALPTAGCLDYEHCPSGYYCEATVRLCRKCIECEDLGRTAPSVDTCVKSIVQCGGCLEGLMVSPASNHCERAAEHPLAHWWWAVVLGALLLALLIGALIVHVLRNFEIYKILACTTTQSPVRSASNISGCVEPSAPNAPPPNAPPPPPPYSDVMALPAHSEESLPFIKSVGASGYEARCDAVEIQSARVFNNPAYVRAAQPQSDDNPNVPDSLPTIQEVSTDNSFDQSHSTSTAEEEEGAMPNLPIAELTAKPVEASQG